MNSIAELPPKVGPQPEAGYSSTSGRCTCGSTVNLCRDGRWRHFGKPYFGGRPTLICEPGKGEQ